ncbi:MAG: 5'-methylthioadenosine/S-adenosylhomocysteine nucleosidase [Firmicutes bacterium]|nr:5'-methylthioadenosine/S-adenosylhomocysteine nucleosidase [Bacillota bacterium]
MSSSSKTTTVVGIVVAMVPEFNAIYQQLIPDAQIEERYYSQVARGRRDGMEYVIVQAGVGTTNAAIGACDLLHFYQPDVVLNLGTAALINDPRGEVEITDVVVGFEHCQWDLDLGGPITPEWTNKRSYVDVLKTNCLRPAPSLLQLVQQVRRTEELHWQLASIYTGNSFFVSDEQHSLLPESAEVVAVDMESFAVAQVCARKGVPFICLRGITDTGTASANQYFYANVKEASKASAKLAQALLTYMPLKEDERNEI